MGKPKKQNFGLWSWGAGIPVSKVDKRRNEEQRNKDVDPVLIFHVVI